MADPHHSVNTEPDLEIWLILEGFGFHFKGSANILQLEEVLKVPSRRLSQYEPTMTENVMIVDNLVHRMCRVLKVCYLKSS